ncbi:hypothetical protein HOD29_05705 [archaeon]|nr:hypothetical protein [archaeon]
MAEQIHQRYLDRNWNLYSFKSQDAETNIRNGPASALEKSTHYVMLPLTETPKNPESIFKAMEALALKRGRNNMPGIEFSYIGHEPCLGITLEESYVHFHNPSGTNLRYSEALKALDILTDARAENN